MAEIRRDEGTFPTRDRLELHWLSATPAEPRAHLALVHGYAEHIGRYAHVVDFFAERGFAVHGFDCRGHGKSGGRRGHVARFQDYLDDLELYLARVRAAASGKKIFLLGHSHGGLIGSAYALTQPTDLAGMVLTSPFIGLAFQPPKLKIWSALAVGKILPWLPVGNELASEQLTRDPVFVEAHKRDPLVFKTTTPGWFVAARGAQAAVLADAAKVTLPLAILVGGADAIADARKARELYERVSSADKTFKTYPGAFHEIMNELNRAEVLGDIAGWLEARLEAAATPSPASA